MLGANLDKYRKSVRDLDILPKLMPDAKSPCFIELFDDVFAAILWITEKNGSCSFLGKQWYDFTGQSSEQALGFGWLDSQFAPNSNSQH